MYILKKILGATSESIFVDFSANSPRKQEAEIGIFGTDYSSSPGDLETGYKAWLMKPNHCKSLTM